MKLFTIPHFLRRATTLVLVVLLTVQAVVAQRPSNGLRGERDIGSVFRDAALEGAVQLGLEYAAHNIGAFHHGLDENVSDEIAASGLQGSAQGSRVPSLKELQGSNFDITRTLPALLMHGAAGAVAGQILHHDPAAGALGAVVGELAGLGLEGLGVRKDLILPLAQASAVLSAGALNRDPDAAAFTSQIVVRENLFFVPLLLWAITAGFTAADLYEAYRLARTEGWQAACWHLGISFGTMALGGCVLKIGGKVVGRFVSPQALGAALRDIPGMSGLMHAAHSATRDGLGHLMRADAALARGADRALAVVKAPLKRMGGGAGKGRIPAPLTDKVTRVSREEIGMSWGKGIQRQGMPFEDYVGRSMAAEFRLPPNTKTFDYFNPIGQHAISVKTLDTTTASRLADPTKIYGTLKRYVDKVADFEKAGLGAGRALTKSMVGSREIVLGIPVKTNPIQWEKINRAIQYGERQGVTFNIILVE